MEPARRPETFEDVLDQVCSLGAWQLITFALIAYKEVWMSMYNLAVIFYQLPTDYHCDVPALRLANWTTQQIVDVSRADACNIYNVSYAALAQLDEFDHGAQHNFTSTVPCADDAFVFSPNVDAMHYTMVSQFGLVCGRLQWVSHAQAFYMAGFLVGALAAGPLSDILGRRWVTLVSMLLTVIVGCTHAYIENLWLFLASRFLIALVAIPGWKAAYTLAMEVTCAKYRTWVGGLYWVPYGVGYALLPLLAWLCRDWRLIFIYAGLPVVPSLLLMVWLLPESPRWQLNMGRVEAARAQLQVAASRNGRLLSDDYDLQNVADNMAKQQSGQQNLSIFALCQWSNGCFTYPTLILRACNLYFNWFVNAMVYYGVTLSVSKFAGDVFWNNSFAGMVEIPAYIISFFLLLLLGRRMSLFLTLALAGITLFIVPWIDENTLNWLKIIFVMSGKFAITASFGIVYVITAELYPTVMRASGLATSSAIARVGSIIAPYIANIDELLGLEKNRWSLFIFGGFSLVAAALTLLLPETKERRLPEQLAEAVKLQWEHAPTKPSRVQPTAADSAPNDAYQMQSPAYKENGEKF